MTAPTHTPNLFAAFLGGPLLTVHCTGEADLMLYDPYDGPECWLAMQDAPHCHDWR